jgi:hypothetical protein
VNVAHLLDAVGQHLRRAAALVQMLVDRVAPGEHDAGNQNLVADFQRADFFLGEGETKFVMGVFQSKPVQKSREVKSLIDTNHLAAKEPKDCKWGNPAPALVRTARLSWQPWLARFQTPHGDFNR